MDNIINLLDKIIVDGQEIDLQSLALINGTLNVGHQKDVIVEYIFKDETQIPSDMFKNLKQLKYAYFPKAGNIKTIGERAFANSNLTYINKLSDINYIGAQAFSYTKLTYVYDGDSPDSIAANAWSYISTLTNDFKNILSQKYPYIDFGNNSEPIINDDPDDPIINVTTNTINVTNNGGEYEITYTITNPLVGITISAVSNVDWITNFNYNTSGKIKFTINPQEANSQQRSGNITLTYGSVNKTITVNQAAGETSGQTSNPIINLTSNNIIEVGNISSQQTITYNISNPISGASISASSNVAWINGFNTSISGQITFNVDAQENNTPTRTGIITLTYPNAQNVTITVNQAAGETSGQTSNPIINLTSNNTIEVGNTSSQQTITYNISNPISGASISVLSNVAWINGFNTSISGQITFNVDAQENNTPIRTGTITLTYPNAQNVTITINQAAGETSGQTSNPIINLTSNNTIEVGNTSSQQTITYNISNPISGASISVSSNVAWINGFNTSISGQITFNVDAQENNALERTGIITLTYPNAQNVTITVNQAAGETSGTEDEGEIINFNGQPSKEGFVTTALGDGKITYNGIYYKIGVKINSSGSVTFTSDDDYNMTLILSLSKAGRNISINGQRYDVGGTESSPVENYYKMNPIRINKNVEYTITKGASESTLMLIILKRIN